MITANGMPVLRLRLTLPLQGIWVASLEVSSEEALTGALTLAQDAVSYRGAIVSSSAPSGICRLEAVGGSGGLGTEVAARSYQGASARSIIGELLASVSETLDGGATRAVLSTNLSYWTRAGGRASTALSTLADALGARWRVLPSGTVWIGTETWPAVAADYESIEVDRDGAAGYVLLEPESIGLAPGVVLRGERVGRVEHWMGDDALRTTFWLEAA